MGKSDRCRRGSHIVTPDATPDALDVYWRPGCPFCSSLKRSLKRRKVPVRMHNIWEDPDAAAVVRSAARGNETVPTVVIGGRALVNPTPQAVEALIAEVAPELLPAQSGGATRRGFWSRR